MRVRPFASEGGEVSLLHAMPSQDVWPPLPHDGERQTVLAHQSSGVGLWCKHWMELQAMAMQRTLPEGLGYEVYVEAYLRHGEH